MSIKTRLLVDSLLSTLLSSMFQRHSIFSVKQVKVAILRFACCALSTPWPDGTTSSLWKAIIVAVTTCSLDNDLDVSTEARVVLQVAQAQITPLVPPLTVVARTANAENQNKQEIMSTSDMICEIEKSQLEDEGNHPYIELHSFKKRRKIGDC